MEPITLIKAAESTTVPATSDAITTGLSISEWLTLITVAATLIVGIINLYSSLRTNKRTTYVNAVTSERVKWIGQLRELISEYLMLTAYYEEKPFLKGEEQKSFFERLTFLKYRIKLHLNQNGEQDKKINDLVERINNKIFDIYEARDLLDIPMEDRIEALGDDFPRTRMKLKKILVEMMPDEKILVSDLNESEKLKKLAYKAISAINDELCYEFGYAGREQLVSYTEDLVQLTGEYLKKEWDRVKNEAEDGKPK
ncbi:hypothetical protein [Paenibacillus alvei]|uniref:hypothetical protein n=1 Tax=Paenibacillus alvei TaxID=44250 RepID=UPI0013DC4713|nr:hypothetical protein [Paenibacillus alvei]NEZ40285.1 hypothetical protein [Paenibacillus alvei]